MLYSIPRTQKNSFSLIILDSKCNCPVYFICHNIPPLLLQFHPCRITAEADFTLTESPKHAAKLVLRKTKYDHVTPLLQELHWLPIKFQPQHKVATFVYRFFNGSLQGYFSQTLCAYEPTGNVCYHVRNSSKSQSTTPKCSGSTPSAFLYLLYGTLCHPISEILVPFCCLNPN